MFITKSSTSDCNQENNGVRDQMHLMVKLFPPIAKEQQKKVAFYDCAY